MRNSTGVRGPGRIKGGKGCGKDRKRTKMWGAGAEAIYRKGLE